MLKLQLFRDGCYIDVISGVIFINGCLLEHKITYSKEHFITFDKHIDMILFMCQNCKHKNCKNKHKILQGLLMKVLDKHVWRKRNCIKFRHKIKLNSIPFMDTGKICFQTSPIFIFHSCVLGKSSDKKAALICYV